MSLVTLLLNLLLALARLMGQGLSAAITARERATGAALQREKDMSDEQRRIAAAARAGLGPDGLPAGPDPMDRDSAQ